MKQNKERKIKTSKKPTDWPTNVRALAWSLALSFSFFKVSFFLVIKQNFIFSFVWFIHSFDHPLFDQLSFSFSSFLIMNYLLYPYSQQRFCSCDPPSNTPYVLMLFRKFFLLLSSVCPDLFFRAWHHKLLFFFVSFTPRSATTSNVHLDLKRKQEAFFSLSVDAFFGFYLHLHSPLLRFFNLYFVVSTFDFPSSADMHFFFNIFFVSLKKTTTTCLKGSRNWASEWEMGDPISSWRQLFFFVVTWLVVSSPSFLFFWYQATNRFLCVHRPSLLTQSLLWSFCFILSLFHQTLKSHTHIKQTNFFSIFSSRFFSFLLNLILNKKSNSEMFCLSEIKNERFKFKCIFWELKFFWLWFGHLPLTKWPFSCN